MSNKVTYTTLSEFQSRKRKRDDDSLLDINCKIQYTRKRTAPSTTKTKKQRGSSYNHPDIDLLSSYRRTKSTDGNQVPCQCCRIVRFQECTYTIAYDRLKYIPLKKN